MNLALNVIAKDQAEEVARLVKDYEKIFDEIVVAVDDEDAFKKISEIDCEKLFVYQYEWRDDFSHKRNFVAEKTKSEYYLRLDTDDQLVHPEKVRQVFKKAVSMGVDVIYVPYLYSSDEDGNCNATHWRETIIRKDKGIYWKKRIHENLFVEDQDVFKGVRDDNFSIYHNITADHADKSAIRNFKILIEEFQAKQEDTDPRDVSYIGRMLMGWGQWRRAIPFLELLIKKSGWEDDKYFAWTHLAMCYLNLNEHDKAISSCYEAMSLNADYPDAYNALCSIYIDLQKWNQAIHWGEIGIKKPKPETLFVLDPTNYTYRPLLNMAIALFGKGDFELAKKFFDKAKSIAPSNEFMCEQAKQFEEAFVQDKYMRSLSVLVNETRHDKDKIQKLVESIPKKYMQDERIHGLRHSFLPSKKWDDKSVVLYCGQSWEEWAPPSVHKGIGGSEEAVVYITKELSKLGYAVTVYNNPGHMEGEYEGVQYKPFWEFNPRDEFNTIIGWRGNIFKGEIKAKRKIIWMHDVPQEDQFSDRDDYDTIIVLSEFHKSLLPKSVDLKKVYVSRNGINLPDFQKNGVLRNPKRMIYTSSYDRGIQHLLKIWKDVKESVPEAELHIFYGWETYDAMMKKGYRSNEFKDAMVNLMRQDGVFEHGRVGHKQLVKEFQQSGLYVYPSHFEEISCISAMKAQACGCVPVTTDYAALSETVKYGVKVCGNARDEKVLETYKQSLIAALNNETMQEDIREKLKSCKDSFSWSGVAKRWSEDIL